MRKEPDVMFLVLSLMFWTQIEGGCNDLAVVSISRHDRVLLPGEGFSLSCNFACLRPQHVAQVWRLSEDKVSESLVSVTTLLPNVTVAVSISSVTKADAGSYYCMTQPPETISPYVLIQIADELTTTALTGRSTPQCDSKQQQSSTAAGLKYQIWFWILLGKVATLLLLLSLVALAVK